MPAGAIAVGAGVVGLADGGELILGAGEVVGAVDGALKSASHTQPPQSQPCVCSNSAQVSAQYSQFLPPQVAGQSLADRLTSAETLADTHSMRNGSSIAARKHQI